MKRIATMLAVAAWLGLIALAFQPLLAYQSKPGKESAVVAKWPDGSKLPRNGNGDTVIMFVHPQCPCSAASLDQLDRVAAKVGPKFQALVVIEQPAFMDKAWSDSAHARHAARMTGVKTIVDHDQVEASRFGATTSGDTFVYSANGELLFHGGITPGRGHEGDCVGSDTVCSILRGQLKAPASSTLSFGCALFNH